MSPIASVSTIEAEVDLEKKRALARTAWFVADGELETLLRIKNSLQNPNHQNVSIRVNQDYIENPDLLDKQIFSREEKVIELRNLFMDADEQINLEKELALA